MQTKIWMSYSNSMHFSDKLSYKILFISSYGLKDLNLANFAHFQETENSLRLFSPRKSGPGSLTNWAGRLTGPLTRMSVAGTFCTGGWPSPSR
jgi:hypothetical protein